MAKQLLMNSLRQQLAHVESFTEVQLNDLLEKLERQKEKISQDDHPIIDWGISFVRTKMEEEKQFVEDLLSEFISKYADYTTFSQGLNFRKKSDWTLLKSSTQEEKDILCNSFMDRLEEFVIDVSKLAICGHNGEYYLYEYLPSLKSHLSLFAKSVPGLDKWVFKSCFIEFNSPKYRHIMNSDYYSKIASAFSMDK
jgi:hypothetical protein